MSVYKDESTGAWYCIFRYKDYSGKTIQKKKKGFRTKREAKDYEIEFQRKLSGNSDMLFESLVELYLADCKVCIIDRIFIEARNIKSTILFCLTSANCM